MAIKSTKTHPYTLSVGNWPISRHKTWDAAHKASKKGHRINCTIFYEHPTISREEWDKQQRAK